MQFNTIKRLDNALFERIYTSRATIAETQEYYLALNSLLEQGLLDNRTANIALDQLATIEQLLVSANALPSQKTDNAREAFNIEKLERTYVANKTLEEISSEILAAATSKQYKLALTKVAAANNLSFEVCEVLAKDLLKEQGIAALHDIDRKDYSDCVEDIRRIELEVADPGEKTWKLQALAKRYKRTTVQLQEVYYKSLIAQHVHMPMSETEFSSLYSENMKWLMYGWLPVGTLVLFHAQGGAGKTLFVQHLIKHLASGNDWKEYKVERSHSILYIQTDTAPLQTKDWLQQSGMLDKGYAIKYHFDWQIEFMAQLYDWIKSDRPDLVVIDSLASASRMSLISENDAAYAKPILQMRDIAKEFNTSFFLIHHSNAADQSRGTKALRNAVDAVWNLKPVNQGDPSCPERELIMEKFRARCPLKYKLALNDENYSWEVLEDTSQPQPVNSAARWTVVNHLHKHRGVKFGCADLAEQARLSENTVRRELPMLVKEGLIKRSVNTAWQGGKNKGVSKHLYWFD